MTSFGNTALVAANTAVAIAACTGLSVKENKAIRSGSAGGASSCEKFEQIEFCSHNYHKVDDRNAECVEVTRSKVLSYLLLYPHIRSIRYSCIGLLAIIGDGTMQKSELLRRWDFPQDLAKMTTMQALNSLYSVESINDIGLIKFKKEFQDLMNLKRNTELTQNITRINLRQYVCAIFYVMLSIGIKDSNVLCWDDTFCKLYIAYAITDAQTKSLNDSIIKNNKILISTRRSFVDKIKLESGQRGFYEAVKTLLKMENS
ncbi:hypothetical protein ANTPLA_LOCUS2985 [Anthophora plagiata]